MSRVAICHMCGYSEDEVEKLHYFPSTLAKSKVWQENMGLKFDGESLRNKRICSRHFTEESYTDLITRKLRPNAVPTLLPMSQPSSVQQPSVSTAEAGPTEIGDGKFESTVTEMVVSDVNPAIAGPSTSQMQTAVIPTLQPTTKALKRSSVFRGIENLSRTEATPRKKQLIRIIERKEEKEEKKCKNLNTVKV